MAARYGTFRAKLLPGVAHSEKTKEIWNRLDNLEEINKSAFIQNAILALAFSLGFQEEDSEKPGYLTDEQWQVYLDNKEVARSKMSYTYYLAFHWLKIHPNFQDFTSGKVVRLALVKYQT